MNIFGFEFGSKKKQQNLKTFSVPEDAGVDTVLNQAGGVVCFDYDSNSYTRNETELVQTYRTMSLGSDIDLALTEIKNEMFVTDVPGRKAVELNILDEEKVSKKLQDAIHEAYDHVYKVMDFDKNAVDLFTRWYIDGRLYLHKIVDDKNLKKGVQKVMPLDVLKIKKVREIPREEADGTFNLNDIEYYYLYTPGPGDVYYNVTSLKINPDAIAYGDSKVYDRTNFAILGHLHKAIVPYNNMKLMEDSLLVYRVSRSPERRVFYVDVGNLPKLKAEEYVRSLMAKFKNRLVYDSSTGNISDRRNVLSMVEDYWLPRREGGRGTEVSSLPGAQNLGVVEDVDYFKKKLYQALNVPLRRITGEQETFIFGRASEIDRDEYKFKKFINRLRADFMEIIEDVLKTQLILTGVISKEEWDEIRECIQWDFAEDNNFVEYKETEKLNQRLETLMNVSQFEGQYFTRKWILQNVLHLTDEQIDELEAEIAKNADNMDDNGDAADAEVEPADWKAID